VKLDKFLDRSEDLNFWERLYDNSPQWDINRPQPEFVESYQRNELSKGKILDVGCDTGDNAIFFAEKGFSVLGIDIVEKAIEKAKIKAKERQVKVDFKIVNVLNLKKELKKNEFSNIIDSGLFHVLSDPERLTFVEQINYALRDRGSYFMMCFSDEEHNGEGPRRISKEEIIEVFSPFFKINYIKSTFFIGRKNVEGYKAYFTSATKINK